MSNIIDNLSDKVKMLQPSGIRKFFDIVSEMPDAISLGVGEPDFVTPWGIRDSAIKSIQKGYTQYTSNYGLPKLRQEISEYLDIRFSLKYRAKDEILVTVGASEAIDLSLRAVINDGDEVIVPDPCYVSYLPNILLAGGSAVPVKMTADNEFKLTLRALEGAYTPRSKAIILPYPNNPTGSVMTEAELAPIAKFISEKNLVVISDEIYAELTYGDKHFSIASLPDMKERTIVISGFSKAFAMTGWRLGYVASLPEVIERMMRIHQYTIMCVPTASQYAGISALQQGKVDDYQAVTEMRDEYNMRRRFVLSCLKKMGLSCFEPRGAFYVFPCVSSTGLNGEEFANRLLREYKVAVVPGSAFGASGENYVRCSYATSMKNLTVAMARMEQFVLSLQK